MSIICLDAGHGGSDPGACGCGLKEKDITLIVANKVKYYLEAVGYTVVMTRTTDIDVGYANDSATEELSARVAISDNAGANLFVSIHCNAFNGNAHGAETIYCEGSPNGKRLAQDIQAEIIGLGDITDRGINTEHVYVVRNTQAVAVLTELAFIDEADDSAKLGDPTWQDNFARAIARGITNYDSGC